MPEQARDLFALTGPAGRTLVISELPASGRLVVDDPEGAGRLGDLNGDLMPFERRVVDGDDDERLLFQCRSGPLRADGLEPIFGPDWTSYAPA
jgi:hypothetical protein